jgi:catechol 2,3-dioxygenase-like lactoylglutathione lyase family enzyme
MLAERQVATTLPARDLDRARRFYAEKLGLEQWRSVPHHPRRSWQQASKSRHRDRPPERQLGREIRMAHESAAALERLEALIGRWKTEGRTTEASAVPAGRIDAIDTYERLPGGALLHLVDAKVGDQKVAGAEIIGYDPARGSYLTQYFGSDGPNAYEASLVEDDGALVWTMRSRKDRFIGTFNDERNVITGHWEALDDDSNWQPWMDVTLTREASR